MQMKWIASSRSSGHGTQLYTRPPVAFFGRVVEGSVIQAVSMVMNDSPKRHIKYTREPLLAGLGSAVG